MNEQTLAAAGEIKKIFSRNNKVIGDILDASQIYFGYTGNMKFIQDGVDHLLDNNLLRKKNEAYYKLIG